MKLQFSCPTDPIFLTIPGHALTGCVLILSRMPIPNPLRGWAFALILGFSRKDRVKTSRDWCKCNLYTLTLPENNFTFLLIEFLIDPVGISYICLENQQIKFQLFKLLGVWVGHNDPCRQQYLLRSCCCRGIRRMCPKNPTFACGRARSVCSIFRPRMAHC